MVTASPPTGSKQSTRDDVFEYTVTGFQCGATTVSAGPLTQSAAGQYCTLSVVIRNIGNQPGTFVSSSQRLIGADGTIYGADTAATVYKSYPRQEAAFAQINPGTQIQTQIVFDVPLGARIREAEFHGSPLSIGSTVPLE